MGYRRRTWTEVELRNALARLQKRAAQQPPFCEKVLRQELEVLIAGAAMLFTCEHPARDTLDTAARLARLGHAKLALTRLASLVAIDNGCAE